MSHYFTDDDGIKKVRYLLSISGNFQVKCPKCGYKGLYQEYKSMITCFYCGWCNGLSSDVIETIRAKLNSRNSIITRKFYKSKITRKEPRLSDYYNMNKITEAHSPKKKTNKKRKGGVDFSYLFTENSLSGQ